MNHFAKNKSLPIGVSDLLATTGYYYVDKTLMIRDFLSDKNRWPFPHAQGSFGKLCHFLTFKDVKSMTWEETFQKIRRLISLEFIRHNELETSSVLTAYEKNNIIFLPETAG